eukprot:1969792-Rhodomonas_salina.1
MRGSSCSPGGAVPAARNPATPCPTSSPLPAARKRGTLCPTSVLTNPTSVPPYATSEPRVA